MRVNLYTTRSFVLLILAWFGFLSPGFTQTESVSITSYYPVPFGSYNTISTDRMSVGSAYEAESIPDDSLIVSGNISIGRAVFEPSKFPPPAPAPATGYLQVSDIWLRAANNNNGAWVSRRTGNVTVTRYGNFLPKRGPICHGDPSSVYFDALQSTDLGQHKFCALTCIVRSDNQDPREFSIPGCNEYGCHNMGSDGYSNDYKRPATDHDTGDWQVFVAPTGSIGGTSSNPIVDWRLTASDSMGSGPFGTLGCAICVDW